MSRLVQFIRNPLLRTDVYKMGHMEQYIPGAEQVYSYLQARSNKRFHQTVFFGLKPYLNYLTEPITHDHVQEFLEYRETILGSTSQAVTDKMFDLADLGYMPLHIKSVPEGTVIPTGNVLMTITNTHPDFYWTVGFVESLILKIWYPITVATTSYEYRKVIHRYFDKTVPAELHFLRDFMVHDFGYRGDSSEESAVISGMSHLTSFSGSDTVVALKGVADYYPLTRISSEVMASVPASEHSVMCSFGRNNELDAYRHMLQLYPTGLVSIVSDTYDIWQVLTEYAKVLKPQILARDGKVVFRPDSGVPELIICGDPQADPQSPAGKGCLRLLAEMFGTTMNSKGYLELNPKVGLIYGDGMYLERYTKTLEMMEQMGFAASNLVIGVGGILRYHSRDTLGFAIKATNIIVNGETRAIMKDPITDPGKRSHTGYLKLDHNPTTGQFTTTDNVTVPDEDSGFLQTVFTDGYIYNQEPDFMKIRQRVISSL